MSSQLVISRSPRSNCSSLRSSWSKTSLKTISCVVEGGVLEQRPVGRGHLLDRAVEEPQDEVAAIRGVAHEAAVRIDDAPPLRLAHVVDRHAPEPARAGVDAARPQEVLGRRHPVDDVLDEREGGLLLGDVEVEIAQPRVAPRQHLIHEAEGHQAHHHRPGQHRAQHADGAHAASPHRGDLAVIRQLAERIERRGQHGQRQGHGQQERDAQEEYLADDRPGQSLPHQAAELAPDQVEEHDAGEREQAKKERQRQLAEEVPGEDAHAGVWAGSWLG